MPGMSQQAIHQTVVAAAVQDVTAAKDCVQVILTSLANLCQTMGEGSTPCNQVAAIQNALANAANSANANSAYTVQHGADLFAGRSDVRPATVKPVALGGKWGSSTNPNQQMIHFQDCKKITITGADSASPLHTFIMDGVFESVDHTGIQHPICSGCEYTTKSRIVEPSEAEINLGGANPNLGVMLIYGQFPVGTPERELAVRFLDTSGNLVFQQNFRNSAGAQMAPMIRASKIEDVSICTHPGYNPQVCPDTQLPDSTDSWSPACCENAPGAPNLNFYDQIAMIHDHMADHCLTWSEASSSGANEVLIPSSDFAVPNSIVDGLAIIGFAGLLYGAYSLGKRKTPQYDAVQTTFDKNEV